MYKLMPDTYMGQAKVVQRLLDGAYIPFDSANTDFQQYLKWLEEGNVPEPAEE
jgi:hypothetical protein